MKTELFRNLSTNGYVVIPKALNVKALEFALMCLHGEWVHRHFTGTTTVDRDAAIKRAHYLKSYEDSPVMDKIMQLLMEYLATVLPDQFLIENRQIIYRRIENLLKPVGYHIDGMFGIFSEGWVDTWPGFSYLAGIPLVTINGPGQGGLIVKPGSHVAARKIYCETESKFGHIDGLKALQAWEAEQKNIDDGILLMASPGDLVLCDSLLVHKPDLLIEGNCLDAKLYFRIKYPELTSKRLLAVSP